MISKVVILKPSFEEFKEDSKVFYKNIEYGAYTLLKTIRRGEKLKIQTGTNVFLDHHSHCFTKGIVDDYGNMFQISPDDFDKAEIGKIYDFEIEDDFATFVNESHYVICLSDPSGKMPTLSVGRPNKNVISIPFTKDHAPLKQCRNCLTRYISGYEFCKGECFHCIESKFGNTLLQNLSHNSELYKKLTQKSVSNIEGE